MYNPKSCNALEKPFYTPLEAALRWCGLIVHEADILARTVGEPIPSVSAFPQWPCLRANAEKIMDAILNNEIPYGRDGKSVCPGEQVNKARLTVRHTDLKAWMAKHYPDQTPAFLFDEIERTTHAKITVEAWQALQAERDALKARLEKAEALYRDKWSKLEAEAKQQAVEPSSKSRNAYLRTIAALGDALIGGGTGQPHTDADAILAALAAKGIAPTLESGTLARYLKQAKDI
ncbi:hypothetical protein [Azotobacter beijerinckii]|uniref:hypothetical protein n=1 Tax=Azotobacter beijerinckii TaxID=170623 RepID=UPI002955BD52|nr:hypothetical protein [Azotobacter beijerinckii]MDV7210134.1 hypothetical protein [Azotobacter beijerinckii]